MSKLVNFKTIVADAVAKLFAPLTGDSPKEAAIRKLGIASELASKGESAKKKAKTELKALGLVAEEYKPGTEVLFDSDRYRLSAVTNEPASRIDQTLLVAEMQKQGLSFAKATKVVADSTVKNKPATSLKVEGK